MSVFAHLAAGGMLNSMLPGLLLFALAWLLTRIFGRSSSASLRFSIWLVALCAIAILPWAGSFGAPSYPMGPAHSTVWFTLPEHIATYLVFAWILGIVLGLAHLSLGLYRLMRLRATCRPVNLDSLDPLLRSTLAEVQPRRRVMLCASDAIRVPAALGYFRPVVVFPAWALDEIPPEELNAIFLHELAHLRRYDDWTNLSQKFAKVIFFFHPAVWFIESHLTLEREIACDEAVLAANFNPRNYAESLVSLAEKSFLRRGIELAQAAVGHVRQLKVRLAEILRKDRPGSIHTRKSTLAMLSVAGLISSLAIARAPQLFTFSAEAPTTAAVVIGSVRPLAGAGLQPVNLTYKEMQPAALGLHPAPQIRPRPVHATEHKASVVLVKRAAANSSTDHTPSGPALLLANFPVELAPTKGPVLVIFQGEALGPNGPAFWRVTVFRLSPVQHRIVTGTIPKQI